MQRIERNNKSEIFFDKKKAKKNKLKIKNHFMFILSIIGPNKYFETVMSVWIACNSKYLPNETI